jgi:DNA-binding LacI/PurR family transcriptional regulator
VCSSDLDVTALVCLKEELAIGADAACRDAGRAVPDSISLIEYACTARSRIAAVPRTGICVHLGRHIKCAWEMLEKSRLGRLGERRLCLVQPTLVRQRSVGPAPTDAADTR